MREFTFHVSERRARAPARVMDAARGVRAGHVDRVRGAPGEPSWRGAGDVACMQSKLHDETTARGVCVAARVWVDVPGGGLVIVCDGVATGRLTSVAASSAPRGNVPPADETGES